MELDKSSFPDTCIYQIKYLCLASFSNRPQLQHSNHMLKMRFVDKTQDFDHCLSCHLLYFFIVFPRTVSVVIVQSFHMKYILKSINKSILIKEMLRFF